MNLIFYIGAFDAIVIGVLGLTGAVIVMLGKDAEVFWSRVVPACGILVATSAAAGIVMAITKWLTGA